MKNEIMGSENLQAEDIDILKENNENEFENNDDLADNQKGTMKFRIQKKKRRVLLLIGVLFLIIGGIGLILFALPKSEEQEVNIATYKLTADSTYRVHLKPNSLLSNEWMEEGLLYPERLTDFVEINLNVEGVLTKEQKVSGEYEISVLLEGYQTRSEEKKTIYERRYPLKKGKVEESTTNHMSLEETVQITPSAYMKFAEEAEAILGGRTSRDLCVLMDGTFLIAGQEKKISYKCPIPIEGEQFYEIKKSEPVAENGEITEKSTVDVVPSLSEYILFLILALVGLAILVIRAIFTRDLREDEIWEVNLLKVMKKYGSRMVCLEELPETSDRSVLFLKNMRSMVELAEEVREPVLYCLGEDGLPKNGIFYVLAKERVYILKFNQDDSSF